MSSLRKLSEGLEAEEKQNQKKQTLQNESKTKKNTDGGREEVKI